MQANILQLVSVFVEVNIILPSFPPHLCWTASKHFFLYGLDELLFLSTAIWPWSLSRSHTLHLKHFLIFSTLHWPNSTCWKVKPFFQVPQKPGIIIYCVILPTQINQWNAPHLLVISMGYFHIWNTLFFLSSHISRLLANLFILHTVYYCLPKHTQYKFGWW